MQTAATMTATPSTDTLSRPEARAGAPNASVSRRRLWTGRILSGLPVLFLAFDIGGKLLAAPAFVQGTVELGYPAGVVRTLGALLLTCVALYLVPRTAPLGAVLLTGYLGGAIATHVRVGSPLFSHTLFPIYLAVLVWGGLALRDGRIAALLGPRPVRG